MSTPSIDRAAEVFREHRAEFSEDDTPPSCTGCDFVTPFDTDGQWDHPAFYAHRIAATVSAALTDPDDDVIARTLREHRPLPRAIIECSCRQWPYDERDDLTHDAHAAHQADAVRAALLGGDA